MSSSCTYSRKVADGIVIESGIMKGGESPCIVEYSSYGEMILERLRANGNFIGQVDGSTAEEETFKEMTEKSVKCAMWLKKQDVEPGDVIGICTHNQMDMYVPCLASLYVGAVYNAWWDNGLTKEMAKHFIEKTRPKILFLTDKVINIVLEAIKEVDATIKIVVFENRSKFNTLNAILQSEDSKNVGNFRCTKLSSLEDPAVILYTSGSTGKPKGVVYSNISLFHNIGHFAKIGGTKMTITLTSSPLSWLSGIYYMLRGIVAPDTRIIYPEFEEEKFCQLVEKYKVNWMLLGTNAAMRLEKYPEISEYDLSSLEILFVGGSAMKGDGQTALTLLFPQTFICQAYGSTELGAPGVQQARNFKLGSCGKVTENIRMKIIDPETGRTLNPNETGEACFKFSYMMKGYYRDPDATRETIDPQGWLHTGDLMYYDEEGNLFFVDRIKEMIKYKGHHVSPTMIEQRLQSDPEIHEVAVVSVPHDIDGEHPIAFVVRKSTSRITEERIQRMVADVLPDYMRLRGGVKFMDELPHTSSDKVAKSTLRKIAESCAR